jgi:osmotically-inducible protein OsmY
MKREVSLADMGVALAGAAGVGAGLMYMLDPDRGKDRRTVLRETVDRTARKTADEIGTASRNVGKKIKDITVNAKSSFKRQPADDVLLKRVGTAVGKILANPRLIGVTINQGLTTLTGEVAEHELPRVLEKVSRIPGVKAVINRLQVKRQLNDVKNGANGGRGTKAAIATTGLIAGGVIGSALIAYYAGREFLNSNHQ